VNTAAARVFIWPNKIQVVMNGNFKKEQCQSTARVPVLLPHEEQHFPVTYWAKRWGFSSKTLREWFQNEFGPELLRHTNSGRRKRREYTTMTISARAAAQVYAKRTEKPLTN
jgi:hypothetical protein